MLLLIVGLLIFLCMHSIRIVAEDRRLALIAQYGDGPYKGVYSLVSLIGLALIVVGYGQTRVQPIFLWNPPPAMLHITSLLVLVAFVLVAAAYVPGNRIKARVGHPMVLGVKVWALAHLLANGRLGDVVLFGAFLIWAVVDYVHWRRRDRDAGATVHATGGIGRDLATVAAGLIGWVLFAAILHRWLIGVSPFGVN